MFAKNPIFPKKKNMRLLSKENMVRFKEIKQFFDVETNETELTLYLNRSQLYTWYHKSEECECIHKWEKTINLMLRPTHNGKTRKGCRQCIKDPKLKPCCANRSLVANEKAMKIWDFDKNSIHPRDLFDTSGDYHWKCKNTCKDQMDCKHEWIANLHNINTRKLEHTGCPCCAGLSETPCCRSKSVAANPLLMSNWHTKVNNSKGLYPTNFRCSSMKLVNWICQNSCPNNPNCSHTWPAVIASVNNSKTKNPDFGCPFCSGRIWVCCILKSAANIQSLVESFDTKHIENNNIQLEKLLPGSEVKVWWKCPRRCVNQLDCYHNWKTSVDVRTRGFGCPHCALTSDVPCCKKKSCANEKYVEQMKDFDFNINFPLTPRNICVHSGKFIAWKCQFCEASWQSPMKIKRKSIGCKKCHVVVFSHGELECMRILKKLNVVFEPQFKLVTLGDKRFDFYFVYKEQEFILEFDGSQHFKFTPKFHKNNVEIFTQKQEVDVLKTKTALGKNYFVIRIDYKCLENIEYHINFAINMSKNDVYYFSNPSMYWYILQHLQDDSRCVEFDEAGAYLK